MTTLYFNGICAYELVKKNLDATKNNVPTRWAIRDCESVTPKRQVNIRAVWIIFNVVYLNDDILYGSCRVFRPAPAAGRMDQEDG